MKTYQSLAGSQSPAAQQAQQYLLQLAVDSNTSKSTMVAAIEWDSAIFATALGYQSPHLVSLARWHEQMDVSSLRALITLIVTQSVPDVEPVPRIGDVSPRVNDDVYGLMHSLLAERLAAHLGKQGDVALTIDARLAGLLAGLNVAPEKLADLSRGWGLAPFMLDALRFFRLPAAELTDVSWLVKILAVSELMVADLRECDGEALAEEPLSKNTLSASRALLALSTAAMDAVLRDSMQAHEQIMAQIALGAQSVVQYRQQSGDLAAASNVQQLVGEVGIGNALYRAFTRQPGLRAYDEQLLASAQFLFGFSGVLHFVPQDDRLVARVSEQENLVLSVAQSDSVIAAAFTQRCMSVVSDVRVVIDLQVMDRLKAVALMIVPLGDAAGVLACGLSASNSLRPPVSTTLMTAFASAASDAYAQQCLAATERAQISLEYLQQRVMEVTHEVNNPLAIVQNYLHVLSLKLDDEAPVQADIVTIGAELTRVASIVGKYAEIGKTADLLSQSVDVNEVLTQLVSVVQGGQVDIEVELQLDPAMPEVVLSPDSLKQVILNLVKNATEALQGAPISNKLLRIETTAAVNVGGREYIEIAMTDNGPGIDPMVRQHLFLPENSTKTGGEGGLGLSIVKQLVDSMQGLISCRSKASTEGSAGTCFQILIPRQYVLDD